jgi:hypothetical protein
MKKLVLTLCIVAMVSWPGYRPGPAESLFNTARPIEIAARGCEHPADLAKAIVEYRTANGPSSSPRTCSRSLA